MSEPNTKIFHTIVFPGETLHAATIRAGFEAGKNGFDGYMIDCEICGFPIHEHETNSQWFAEILRRHYLAKDKTSNVNSNSQ